MVRRQSLLLGVFLLILGACANPQRHAVEEAIAATQRRSMQRVESKDQVLASLAARERLVAARREYARWLRCEDGPGPGAHREACEERAKPRVREVSDDDAMKLDRVEVTGSRVTRTQLEGAMPVTSVTREDIAQAGIGGAGDLLAEQVGSSITNNQSAHADEGDIVKKIGPLIIVLREGRLFVLRIRRGDAATLEIVDKIEVVPGVRDPDLGIDEVLAFPGGLFVLGYDYEEGTSELFAFRMSGEGRIERGAHYQIKGEDYHVGDGYGARVIGDHLVMVRSTAIDSDGDGTPPVPRWRRVDVGTEEWMPMSAANDFFLPIGAYDELHANMVVRCSLASLLGSSFRCETTAILGGPMTPYHVTERAVYLAIQGWDESALLDPEFSVSAFRSHREQSMPHEHELRTTIYEIPFARFDRPRIARLVGDMTDRFAFEERDGRLMVVTHMRIPGDKFKARLFEIDWGGSSSEFEVPARQLGEFDHPLDYYNYRFDRATLWLGSAQRIYWKDPGDTTAKGDREVVREYAQGDELRLFALPLAGGPAESVPIAHSTDRIERFGDHVFLTGPDRDQRWTASVARHEGGVLLSPPVEVRGYLNAEHMSHAFNVLVAGDRLFAALPGVPMTAAELGGQVVPGDPDLDERVSDIVMFELKGDALALRAPIDMQVFGREAPGDRCQVSCTDWYGNARAFGAEGRYFALSAVGFVEFMLEGDGHRVIRQVRLDP